MIVSYGLTHIALLVSDTERSSNFYQKVFGTLATDCSKGFIQVQSNGYHDVIVFEPGLNDAPRSENIKKFGFRLIEDQYSDSLVKVMEDAAGQVHKRTFWPQEPCFFYTDMGTKDMEILCDKVSSMNASCN